jgi:hypothetical protein
MKIFVAFGYNERDQWIPDLVFPMIRAFRDEVVSGEDIQGEQITDAVRREIKQANALMAFATRRKKLNNRSWSTHRWVTDELAYATANNLHVVEIREKGVDEQGGIVTDRQRIIYDERERDKCLVEIVKTLGNWHASDTIELKLLPDECMQAVRPHLRDPNLRCTYQILENGRLGEMIPSQILPITGGLFVRAYQVPPKSFIQIRIECGGRWWSSEFENVESVGIHLHEE